MSPAAEVLWSYMTGLAPVGETFEIGFKQYHTDMKDVGVVRAGSFYNCINELIVYGILKRVAHGGRRSGGIYYLKDRPETKGYLACRGCVLGLRRAS